jgi:hypothetical protein
LQGERTGEDKSVEEFFFDINAKLEEQKRTSRQATLAFSLSVTTKPSVAKYAATGMLTLEGDAQDISKKLEVNPKTKIPQILFTVYQHVFSSIYLLSSVLDAPYPPPDLLHPMQEKIQILPQSSEHQAPQPQQEKTVESTPEPKTANGQDKIPKDGSTQSPKPAT